MRCLKGRRGLINRHIAIAAPNGGAVKRTSEAAPTPMPQAKSQVRSSVSQYRSNVSSVTNMAKMKRSEEHTSELQSLMRISYAVFCLKKKKQKNKCRQQNIETQTETQNT